MPIKKRPKWVLVLLLSYCLINLQVEAGPLSFVSRLVDIFEGLGTTALLARNDSNASFSRDCLICKFMASLVHYVLQTKGGADQVQKIAISFCTIAQLESPDVCTNITTVFKSEFIKVLSNAVLTPNQICGAISGNRCGRYTDPFSNWEVNLQASLLIDQRQLNEIRQSQIYQRSKIGQNSSKPFRVIHISDSHIDVEYESGSLAVCDEPLCCKPSSTFDTNPQTLDDMFLTSLDSKLQSSLAITSKAGHWGSYGHCDIPMRTFESLLKKLNETLSVSSDIPYIIWSGDVQPHDVWRQNKRKSIETYRKVFKNIFHYLPNTRILPTVGNHEMVPVDSFSPSNLLHIAREDSPNWLYEELSVYWLRWLPNDTLKTITKDGFYAVKLRPDLKLISLNTNFCDSKNFWLYINATDPGNQLEWLIHELQLSEFASEYVHIVGHIPPGSEDCLVAWSKNYNRIISRFKQTVTAQFFGHTHNGEFEIFYDIEEAIQRNNTIWQRPVPISVAFVAPSTTTFVGLNPGFRIFSIEPARNYMPVNFDTYFMNLTEANENPGKPPKWTNVGSFTKIMDIKDTSPESLEGLIMELLVELKLSGMTIEDNMVFDETVVERASDSGKLFKLYKLFYNYSDLFTKEIFESIPRNEKKKFLCRLVTSQSGGSTICKDFMH